MTSHDDREHRSRTRGGLLLVGDESQATYDLLHVARCAGYDCEHCTEARDVRQVLLCRAYTAVIADLDRGGGDGVPLLAMLRRFAPEAWIVALLPARITPTPTMGYDVALAKPAAPELVLAALGRMPS
ncbi:MAG TPA: hypothetical protein VG755_37665 [Nannocystaceae bacterium]|nr:hypothetical protein [Nannocystaceae bacterium]